MKLSIFDSLTDGSATRVTVEWSDLVDLLMHFTPTECAPCKGKHCKSKQGKSWSPATFAGDRRGNANAEELCALVFDLDDLTPGWESSEWFARVGSYRAVVHSSHSHTPEAPRLRIVLPLEHPYPAKQWRKAWLTAALDLGVQADESCKDTARLYFLPTCPVGGPEPIALVSEGPYYSFPKAAVQIKPTPVHHRAEPENDETESEPIDPSALLGRLAELRTTKARQGNTEHAELLDAIVRGTAIARLGNRSVRINQAASLCAFALPPDVSVDTFAELITPALARTELGDEGLTHWLGVAMDSFRRAQVRRADADAARKAYDDAIRARLCKIVVRPDKLAEVDPDTDPFEQWQDLLLKSPKDAVISCGENAFVTLLFSEETRDTIKFDLVSKKVAVCGGPFEGASEGILEVEVCDWLQRHHGIGLKPHDVGLRIARVAWANRFDPIADYLNGLQWDGVDRLSVLFEDYAKVSRRSPSGENVSRLADVCGHKWARSAVARALSPGCKVDTVLILEGAGGLGKSTFFEILAGDWFCQEKIVIGDKDSKQLAATHWICELGELESFKRAEDSAKKLFFAQRIDKFRPPYGKAPQDFPRRAVFVGTTNDRQYLTDRTGNRRYWPFASTADFDRAEIRRDRDQIWAQAVAEFRAWQSAGGGENGHHWWLTPSEQTAMDCETEARLKDAQYDGRLIEWWFDQTPSRRPLFFTAAEAATKALQFPPDRLSPSLLSEVGIALEKLGFERKRTSVLGRQVRGFAPTEELKNIPRRGHAALQEVSGDMTAADRTYTQKGDAHD